MVSRVFDATPSLLGPLVPSDSGARPVRLYRDPEPGT